MRYVFEKNSWILSFLFISTLSIFLISCQKHKNREVVIYTSLDQTFSEPILKLYEQKSGVTVKAVYDIEAAKTTGLVNRLVAEKLHPRADIFWSSEVVQTIYLKEENILEPYISTSSSEIPEEYKDSEGYWTGFAARARVIAYNPKLVQRENVPETIFGLTNTEWKGQVAIANPLFGTTATHAAVLFSILGEKDAMAYFTSLKENNVVIVSGNSHARDLVLRGKIKICLTDTDDVISAKDRGGSIEMIFPDKEGLGTLLIPNTIALIKGGPHPIEAKKLIDFLLSPEVEQMLANSSSAQIPVREGLVSRSEIREIHNAKIMNVDFEKAYEYIGKSSSFLISDFLPK